MTNIFSPPTYVDYKRRGTEPVVTVDRYAYPVPNTTGLTDAQKTALLNKECPGGVVPATATTPAQCYKDIVYIDSTEGFGYPQYDFFWKSENLGQTFRLPKNDPTRGGRAMNQGRGGGDGFQAVGALTHRVYFIDLAFTNVTMNTSDDRGDTFFGDEFGSGTDTPNDRQWDDADEAFPSSTGPTQNVYINYNALLSLAAPTLVLKRSTHGGAPGSFVTDSNCEQLTAAADNPTPGLTGAVDDNKPTKCPDPVDPTLSVAGPIVVDKSTIAGPSSHPHRLYIPFLRCTGDAAT
ncbi:MAG: hypothetical protein LC737_10290, partial [Chloroflexi bacterium]|nr:hypothetical protein [Chloroflexota bacterium]